MRQLIELVQSIVLFFELLIRGSWKGLKIGWHHPSKLATEQMRANLQLQTDAAIRELEELVDRRTRKWSKRHRDQKY